MNYINEDKKIRHLEESIRELEKWEEKKIDLEQIKKWKRSLLLKWKMIQDIDEWNSLVEERNDLLEENKKLKSDLSECECSFQFESDEVWFWKREYKRLKKWIKDHCKWYWNLFPEDEMKRQWKKADKKRK